MPKPPPAATDVLADSAFEPEPAESEADPEGFPPDEPMSSPTAGLRDGALEHVSQLREWSLLAPPTEHFAGLQRGAELRLLGHELGLVREASRKGPTPEEQEDERRAAEEVRRKLIEKLEAWAAEDEKEEREQQEAAQAAESTQQR